MQYKSTRCCSCSELNNKLDQQTQRSTSCNNARHEDQYTLAEEDCLDTPGKETPSRSIERLPVGAIFSCLWGSPKGGDVGGGTVWICVAVALTCQHTKFDRYSPSWSESLELQGFGAASRGSPCRGSPCRQELSKLTPPMQ